MSKKYCENCVYGNKFSGEEFRYCGLPERKILNEFTKFEHVSWTLKNLKNSTGDCRDYKKKWWKFWVK